MTQTKDLAVVQRPLWRRIVDYPLVALVIAVVLFMAASALAMVIGKPLDPMPHIERTVLRAIIGIVLVVAVYKLVIARLGEHPRDDLRVDWNAGRNLAFGLATGFAIMALAVGVAGLLGVYRIVGPGDTSRLVLELVTVAILPGVREELLFRGILFRWIEEFGGSWAALAVTSALFGLAHIMNPNATWFSSFAIAVEAGVLLGGTYMLTRSLWFPMGLHAAWNFTQGEIFDVPVSGIDEHGLVQAQLSGPPLLSGGSFGLEASLIALIPATAIGVWLVWLAVRQGKVVAPHWVRHRKHVEAPAT
jgi:membrane protease YdiL (CAAX protease family)